MASTSLPTVVALAALLAVTVPFVGRYLAAVLGDGGTAPGERIFGPVERLIHRAAGIDPDREQPASAYAASLLVFSALGVVALYALLRLQHHLPFDPTGREAVSPAVAFNTAVSFVTNTNWQAYGGEQTMSHLSQMAGLTVQNFVSAAAGMAVAVAVVRGFTRRGSATIGNFWADLVRSIVRILLPLALMVAVVLAGLGVIQNGSGFDPVTGIDGTEQVIPGGPVASQVAIKQLGTNGGGFFNANSATPFENPTPLTNLVELWAMMVIPLAFPLAFGRLVGDRRQGRLLLMVMGGLWLASVGLTLLAQAPGNGAVDSGVDQTVAAATAGGGWMEGTEVRFGTGDCAIWAASTTGTSNGSVNCMHDSMPAAAGLVPLVNILLGEVSPGGVGVGLMGLLVYALLAVFIAGLMVGRTPEYLGKKIQATEIKLLMLFILVTPVLILGFSAASVVLDAGLAGIQDPGPHGFTEVLYAFGSGAGNNGSAFAGLGAGSDWYTTTVGLAILGGRFLLIIPALALAGSLAAKDAVPSTSATFPTHTPLFGALVAGVVVLVAGLTFFPALALGPIAESLGG